LDDLWVKSCLLIGNLVVGGWEDEGGMSSMSPTAEVSEEPKRNRRDLPSSMDWLNGKFTKKTWS